MNLSIRCWRWFFDAKLPAPEQFSDQDREPDFDLVDPGRMIWGEVAGDAMARIAQECLARCHWLEDAAFSVLAEVVLDAPQFSHEAGDALRHVGVEVVADDVPRCGW